MDVYAVFDGHGGKQAATFASRNLTEKLVGLLRKSASSDKTSKGSPDLHKLSFPAELDNEVWTYWESQDKLMEVLPGCLTEAFCKLQEDFFQQTKVRPDNPSPSFWLKGLACGARENQSLEWEARGSSLLPQEEFLTLIWLRWFAQQMMLCTEAHYMRN